MTACKASLLTRRVCEAHAGSDYLPTSTQTTFQVDGSVSFQQWQELLALYLNKLSAMLQVHLPGLASIQSAVQHSGLEDVLETAWDYIRQPVRVIASSESEG
jgi:hypothetical protein